MGQCPNVRNKQLNGDYSNESSYLQIVGSCDFIQVDHRTRQVDDDLSLDLDDKGTIVHKKTKQLGMQRYILYQSAILQVNKVLLRNMPYTHPQMRMIRQALQSNSVL